MTTPLPPVLGPCSGWITGADVAALQEVSVPDGGAATLDAMAEAASLALYEIAGRQFPGVCERLVRPCRDGCSCFGYNQAAGLGPWTWGFLGFGGGWGWRNECGDRCGCGTLSRVRLAGYPVREILQVKVDGQILAPDCYRLDRFRWLIRMGDPGPPQQDQFWPSCQDLSLNDDQPGTFSVAYTWGLEPPLLGRQAAAQLAWQLYLTGSGDKTVLPAGVSRITRQGVQVDGGMLVNWFNPEKSTGLVSLDTFLRAYWPLRSGRRGAVYSPDLQPFARPVGNTAGPCST